MALLQRTRILANQRLDLPDYNRIEDFACADFKALHKNIWSNQNFVFSGFVASGVGTNTISIVLANSALVLGQNDGVVYIGAPSLASLDSSSLSPSTTNYIELSVTQDTGGADSRAFWDPTAAGGAGAEFSQIVDTFTFLKTDISISTSSFSGDADKIKICEVDTNGSGVITEIRDRRDLFFRLGRGTNTAFTFPWASRTEPPETQFTGADKDIRNLKQWSDSVMDSIREIKGTTYWYENAPITLAGSFQNLGLSILIGNTSSAKLSWSGSLLSITDDNGSPLDSDVLIYLRLFNSTADLALTRQDSGAAITLTDGDVLWIEIPDPLLSTTYDGVGPIATNYRVDPRGSIALDESVFWLAYREGTRLYVRDLGELEAGEAHEISDETTSSLATFLGFDPEVATSVPYSVFPDAGLPASFTTADDLVTTLDAETENINAIYDIINTNAYEEAISIISGAPSGDNELTGPIVPTTIITLPLDSRDSDSLETYIVGYGTLEVLLNGNHLNPGDDWSEVGTIGTASNQIEINIDLVVDDVLNIRQAVYGGFFGGGGGGTSLQTAYLGGSTISTSIGNPVTIGGSAAKVLVCNGDITVTGVIDPKGITFSRESSNPLPSGQDGFWVNASGEVVFTQDGVGDINISQDISGGFTESTETSLINQSGGTLTKLTPVRIDSLGYLDSIDVSVEDEALAAVGLIVSDINDTDAGNIVTNGVLSDITTSASLGDVLYVSKTGGVTNVKPSIGVGGFLSGDWVIRLGVIARNALAPAQKDLIVNVCIVGQL